MESFAFLSKVQPWHWVQLLIEIGFLIFIFRAWKKQKANRPREVAVWGLVFLVLLVVFLLWEWRVFKTAYDDYELEKPTCALLSQDPRCERRPSP